MVNGHDKPGIKPSTIQVAELVPVYVDTQTHTDLVGTTDNKGLLRWLISE